ncbi:MAG: carbonic anhydrase [Rhodomicrobium sp.]|nr:MAG: carbonic anhydrase [Rhodomicrobium sp.]
MKNFPSYLIEGHKKFKREDFPKERSSYEKLATVGQAPKVLVVGCSDSRVDPSHIFNAEAGDLFMVRNVANLVPPYEADGAYHGVSAALEFGVMHLEVEHVVVLGHTGCGGIHAMLDPDAPLRDDMTFITNWVSMMSEERDIVCRDMPDSDMEDQMDALEQRSISASLENLKSFPFIQKRVSEGKLALHGAYFDVATAGLYVRDGETGTYSLIE